MKRTVRALCTGLCFLVASPTHAGERVLIDWVERLYWSDHTHELWASNPGICSLGYKIRDISTTPVKVFSAGGKLGNGSYLWIRIGKEKIGSFSCQTEGVFWEPHK